MSHGKSFDGLYVGHNRNILRKMLNKAVLVVCEPSGNEGRFTRYASRVSGTPLTDSINSLLKDHL